MSHEGFPKLQKRISDFLMEEEGNIPRSKIISVGTMLLLLSVFFVNDAFAGHRSHSSHRSHGSHSSHSSGSYHRSHVSHTSHSSHSSGSHNSHSSHSNHGSHSNHSNATPVPIPNNVSLPSTAEVNISDTVLGTSGYSLNPASTPDPNIVLTRSTSVEVAPIASTANAGISTDAIASSGSLESLAVGTTSQSLGSIPVTSGVVIPDPSSLGILGTESNTFPAEVKDVQINPAKDMPSTNQANLGSQPKGGGKPIE